MRIYRHLEGKRVLYLLVVVILGSTVQDVYGVPEEMGFITEA